MASAENLNDHHTSGSFPVDPMHQFEIKKYIDLNLGGLDMILMKFMSKLAKSTMVNLKL